MSERPDDASGTRAGDEVTITPYRNGPLIVRGPVRLLDGEGNEIDAGRATIALCRCGRSTLKPFCDGSHAVNGFRAAAGDERSQETGAAAPALRFDRLLPAEPTRELGDD